MRFRKVSEEYKHSYEACTAREHGGLQHSTIKTHVHISLTYAAIRTFPRVTSEATSSTSPSSLVSLQRHVCDGGVTMQCMHAEPEEMRIPRTTENHPTTVQLPAGCGLMAADDASLRPQKRRKLGAGDAAFIQADKYSSPS